MVTDWYGTLTLVKESWFWGVKCAWPRYELPRVSAPWDCRQLYCSLSLAVYVNSINPGCFHWLNIHSQWRKWQACAFMSAHKAAALESEAQMSGARQTSACSTVYQILPRQLHAILCLCLLAMSECCHVLKSYCCNFKQWMYEVLVNRQYNSHGRCLQGSWATRCCRWVQPLKVY